MCDRHPWAIGLTSDHVLQQGFVGVAALELRLPAVVARIYETQAY